MRPKSSGAGSAASEHSGKGQTEAQATTRRGHRAKRVRGSRARLRASACKAEGCKGSLGCLTITDRIGGRRAAALLAKLARRLTIETYDLQ